MAAGEPPDTGPARYIAIATYLPVRRWRDVFAFIRLAGRVLQQAKESTGNVAAMTRGNPVTRNFWTCTIWKDRNSVKAFLQAEPHATAIRRMADWAANDAAFGEWEVASGTIDWTEAMRRLEQPTYYYKKPTAPS